MTVSQQAGPTVPVAGGGGRRPVVRWLRRLRNSQPLNLVATSAARALLRTFGVRSEWLIRHLHRCGSVRTTLPNGRLLRLWSEGDDWVSNQVFWRGWQGYEPESALLFWRLAARARVTFDVGAYVGFYSLLAGHANPGGRVFAFEPLPSVFRRLENHVALNRLTNVECACCAVGAVDGEATFYQGAPGLPTSSGLSADFHAAASAKFTVPVITLDRFVREKGLTAVDLVKLDTETTEPQVLAGVAETLRRARPVVFCEVLCGVNAEAPLERALAGLDYRFFHLTGAGPVERPRIEAHREWLNYLFVPRERDAVNNL